MQGVPCRVSLSSTHLLWTAGRAEGPGPGIEEAVGFDEVLGVMSRSKPGAQRPGGGGLCGVQDCLAPGRAADGPSAVVHAIRRQVGRPHLWHPWAIELSSPDVGALDALCHRIQQGGRGGGPPGCWGNPSRPRPVT